MALEPITRQEKLLNAVATGGAKNLEPITREEMFLAKLGGADVNTPTPITRKEQFLKKAIEQGGSGGGDVNLLDLKKTITEYRDDTIVKLPNYAFFGCTNLKMVVLPKVEDASIDLFGGCESLEVIDFTALKRLGEGYLYDEHHPTIPYTTKALVNRGGLFQMGDYDNDKESSGIGGYPSYDMAYMDTYIYIPRECIVAENFLGTTVDVDFYVYPNGYDWDYIWNNNLERIRAIEDYTVDGTVTGALDFAKMGIDMG